MYNIHTREVFVMKNVKKKPKPKTETAVRLKALRKEKGVNGIVVAESVGINASTYRRYETTVIPPSETLLKLAVYFGVTVDYLLSGSEYPRGERVQVESPESAYKVVDSDIGELSEFEIMALKKLRSISDSDRRDVAKYLSSKKDV